MEILGIDVGGSGIKGAPVDIHSGELLGERIRIPTPQPSKPQKVANVVAEITNRFDWKGPIGVGFPAPMVDGRVMVATNIHKKWVGKNVAALLAEATGCPVYVFNDADAAGTAEMRLGTGKGRKGVVILITIGTGLGSAIFTEGCLVPGTELGHLEVDGKDAEIRASDAARKREKLSWKKWAKRFDRYLHELESLFSPNLFIIGGGISKKHELFFPYLTTRAEVVPAKLLNNAGIVGAALAAKDVIARDG
jgi:polyphosphate glucokinase